MLDFSLIYTAVVLLAMIVALLKEWLEPAAIVFSSMLFLTLGGVISVDEAFRGFSNKGMITVGFLFVVSAALQSSGAFAALVSKLLGSSRQRRSTRYFRLMLPVAGLSAFLNNTPIVATLIPIIKSWAKKTVCPAPNISFLFPMQQFWVVLSP